MQSGYHAIRAVSKAGWVYVSGDQHEEPNKRVYSIRKMTVTKRDKLKMPIDPKYS